MFLNGLLLNSRIKCICLIIRSVHQGSSVPEYYHRLEIPTSATTQEIKSSYFRLSKVFHPDISTDPDAKNKFSKIAEAYECLSNQQLRLDYDRKHKLNSFNNQYSSSVIFEDEEFVKYTKFKRRGPIMKGRTSHFDYNEHFKSHYGSDSFNEYKFKNNGGRFKGDEYLKNLAYQNRTNRRLTLTFFLIISFVIVGELFKKN